MVALFTSALREFEERRNEPGAAPDSGEEIVA